MSTSSRPRVPDGLRELMKDLTREILKEKPIDIYDFAANYFQTRLPQKEDYAVRDYEPNTNKYDFSYIQNPQRYQVPVALVYSIVPECLTNLIKDLIKAILREQPQNLCDFAVEYFRHLKTATQEVDTNEISYTTYDNYFTNKERFLFTPYVKCTCGRTFGEGFGSSYQLDHLSTIHHVHRIDSSSKTETITTLLEDTNNNHVKAGQENYSVNSEKFIKSIYVIQRYVRRYLKKTKTNNLSTAKHSITQNNCMNENDGGGGSKVIEKQLPSQNNEIVPVVPHLQINHNENDNISETASYTSASTALMSASESGRDTSETSENMLRKTIMEREEIENENFTTRPERMSMEDSTHIDGNRDNEGPTLATATKEAETTVNHQEPTASLEKQNTVPTMEKGRLMRSDFTDDEYNDQGVNKYHNSDHVDQKEDNLTNVRGVKDFNSLNNITSNDTKKYNDHQLETTNDKILQSSIHTDSSLESDYIQTEVDKTHNNTKEEEHQQKAKIGILQSLSNHKLNNEYVLEKPEIQRNNLTNSIDEHSNQYSNENEIVSEESLVKEADVVEIKDEFQTPHLGNKANVIDVSMEKLCETVDAEDLKMEHTENSISKDTVIESEPNLVAQELLRESQNDIKTSPNENQDKRTIVKRDTKRIENENDVIGVQENVTKSTEQTIKQPAEFLLQSNPEKQNESDLSTNEVINSNENDSFKKKEENSNLCQANILSMNVELTKQAEHESNANGSVTETDKLVLNKTRLDVPEIEIPKSYLNEDSNKYELDSDKQEYYLAVSNNNRIENKLIKDLTEISADHNFEKKHDSIDENYGTTRDHDENEKPVALQQLPNKFIDIETKKYSSNSNFENESNPSNNEVNISSDNDITTEPDVPALTTTQINSVEKKTNDDNQLPNKFEDDTDAEQTNQVHSIGEEQDIINEYKESYDTGSKSENHTEPILNEFEQQQSKPSANESNQENIETPEREKDVFNIVNNPNQINEMQTEKAAESSNEHESVKTVELQDTHENTNINKIELYEDEDEGDNKSEAIYELKKVKEVKLSKDETNNKSISNEALIVKAEELQQDDQKESDSHEQIYIEEKKLGTPNDEDITKLSATISSAVEISKDDKNTNISNESTIMKATELQPTDSIETDSHEQIYIKDLDKPNDGAITQLRETPSNKDKKTNNSISKDDKIMKEEKLQPDDQKESDSHEQIYEKDNELNTSNDGQRSTLCSEVEISKDDKNKSISNEATILKAEELQPTDSIESDSHEQINRKHKDLDKPSDGDITQLRETPCSETETNKDKINNNSISNDDKIMKEEELQPDDQKEFHSHEQIYEKDNEVDTENKEDITTLKTTSYDETENSIDDKNNKSISNEATIMTEEILHQDDQKKTDSNEQIYMKDNELDTPNDEDITNLRAISSSEVETSNNDKNKYISNEATTMEGEKLKPDDQKEFDSLVKIYEKYNELDTSNDEQRSALCSEVEISKDDKNKSISNEATILKAEELQPNDNIESDSHEQIHLKYNELNEPNDGDITQLMETPCSETETSKDDKNNKYLSNDATIIKAEELQPNDQKEFDSHDQIIIKEKELDIPNITKLKTTSCSETITSNDDKNNKSISNEAIIMEGEKLKSADQKEKQKDLKGHEVDERNDADITQLRETPCSGTEISKDDKNNKSISNETTIIKAEEMQQDDQNEFDYAEQKHNKDNELDKPNDGDITTLTATSYSETETSKDDKNNKPISNEAIIMEGDKLQPDDHKESDYHEQIYLKEKVVDKLKDEDITTLRATSYSETETSKDDTNNKYISNETTIMAAQELQPNDNNETDSHDLKHKDLDKSNDGDITQLKETPCEIETSKDDKNNKSISNEIEELEPDDQRESDFHNRIFLTKSKNQESASIKNELNVGEIVNQEAQHIMPIVDDLNINKDLIIPNQIEKKEIQSNESIVKELIETTDPNSKETQDDQLQPQIDTMKVAVVESGEQIENNDKSFVKDEFQKYKQKDSEDSPAICGTDLDKQKLTTAENESNEDEVIKQQQITSNVKTDQLEKLNNKSLESNNENLLQEIDELKVQEATELRSEMNESGVLKNEDSKNIQDGNEKCNNLPETEIKKEQFHEIYNEETSGTTSSIDESDLDHRNKVVFNSTQYEQMEPTPDNKKTLSNDTIHSTQSQKLNVEENVQINILDENKEVGNYHHDSNDCSTTKPAAITNALINKPPSARNLQELESKSETVTDHKDKLEETNEIEIEKFNVNTDNHKPDATKDRKDSTSKAKTTLFEDTRDVDIEANRDAEMNIDLGEEETCENYGSNFHEIQTVQENSKIDNDESNFELNEYVRKNSISDIDEAVHRILTERLKELRIQNEQKVLGNDHSEEIISSSNEIDIKQNEQSDSDVNSKTVTNNILHTPNQDANENSLIVAESETYLFENRGDKKDESNVSPNEPQINQDVVTDHSENVQPSNVNRTRRSLSKNEKQNLELNVDSVESLHNDEKKHAENAELKNDQPNSEDNTENNTVTKISMDQVENQGLFNDKPIANFVASKNENDQETTLHNIGNKSPETLIGNQNLNIGRIRNYNEGLIESISGQRFAETHLKSFWKEYQMNNGKPLDQYDCGGNEKVVAIKEQPLTEKYSQSLNDNLEMVNHTTEKIKINENEYVLIKAENNFLNEVKNLNLVDSMTNQENSPVESSHNQNISEGIEDANPHNNDINHNKNVERIPRYFHGSIPIEAKHNLLEKRKAIKEPTAFTIPLEKAKKLKNNRKSSSTIKACTPECTDNDNKEINLGNCEDVEPLLDSETPTKLFNELNEFDYDETHDIDLEITYTIDEIVRLKTEYDSQKNSDEESEFERNQYSPIIIRLTTKEESQPISDDCEEAIIDLSEFSPTPESMLHTIVELSESETPRPDSKTMISSPALLQPNDEDYLTNLEKISHSTSTSWTSGSKEGEDYSFVSDEFLEDENYHKEISPTKTVPKETQGGIYEYIKGKITEEVRTDLKEYENLIKEAPSPPNDDPFHGDAAYCENQQRKTEVSTENNEYSDEIINGKLSLLMAVCTIQRSFRSYQLRKNHIVPNNSDTIKIDQPKLETINNNEYSNEIASAGQTYLNAVYIIQRAFRKYQLRKIHMNPNNSTTITHESIQLSDHSKNNMAAIVIQKAFRHYLDHKLKSTNEQESNVMFDKNSVNSPANDVKDEKNENVGMTNDLHLTQNFMLEDIPKREDEIKNTIIETQQNSLENDEECITNLSEANLFQNATDLRKSPILTSIKNENIIIGQFINSERQYSDSVNQRIIKFEEPQKEIKSTLVLAELVMDHSVLLRSDFEGETNSSNTKESLTKEIVGNNEAEELVGSATPNKNYIGILENPKNSSRNAIETLIDNRNDLVENLDGSSEVVAIENDYITRNEVDILVPAKTMDAMENPSEKFQDIPNEKVSCDNQHDSLRSKEPSKELAAAVIQKAFRSYLQIKNKNKPHEIEVVSNEVAYFQPTAPNEDDFNSYSSATLNSTSSYRGTSSEEQAARIIQKTFKKFMRLKAEHQLVNENTKSGQTTIWFVGDEPIITNESLLRSASEISFDETESYVELKDSPQYSVDLCSNLDKSDANNLSRSPTAPVSYRSNSSSSVDLSNVRKTNLSEETVYVVGTGINTGQLTNKNQEYSDVTQKDSSDPLANDGKSLNQFPEIYDDTLVAFHHQNLESIKNVEIAKLQNLTSQFMNSERQYSDVVNQSNPSIQAPKEVHLKTADSPKDFSDSLIPYEEFEELCIKKTISKSVIINDSNDEELSTSSDMDNDTEDSLSMKTVKLHEPEEAIEKMKQRRDSTTKIPNIEKPKDYNFDEPLVEPIDNLDKDEDGIVVCKLKREETLESSAQSEEDVVIGEDSQTLAFFEPIDIDTQFPAKGSLKRVHTIAGDADAKSLLKNVTIDESIKYIEPPDFEVNSGSFCLDEATSQNIRRNMMAYSISEADSDYSDQHLNNPGNTSQESKSQKYDDFNVSTALVDNEDTSTETESTIVSAVTKIQAGARGYLTRKRLGRTCNTSDHKSMAQDENSKASFGNAAISESLEHLVQEAAAKRIQKVYRKHYRQKLAKLNQQNEIISPDLTTSMESSLAQKRSIMLQRGDALRNDSTPDEGNSSSNGSDDHKAKIKITDESKAKYITKQQTEIKSTEGSQSLSSQAKMTAAAIRANKIEENKKRWLAMRQNSMPVQIDSEVLRVIPKHMRKKIKSAEGEKKRNGRRRVLKD